MKDILFNLLNNSAPYKNIYVVINNNEFVICRDDAHFPMATHFIRYEPEMTEPNYFYEQNSEETVNYVNSHKITLHDMDYLIETELSSVSYYETYFHVSYNSLSGLKEFIIPYNAISYIGYGSVNSYSMSSISKTIEDYNKIQYELNKGD